MIGNHVHALTFSPAFFIAVRSFIWSFLYSLRPAIGPGAGGKEMNKTVPLPLQDLLSWVGRQSEMRPQVRGAGLEHWRHRRGAGQPCPGAWQPHHELGLRRGVGQSGLGGLRRTNAQARAGIPRVTSGRPRRFPCCWDSEWKEFPGKMRLLSGGKVL